MRHKTFFKGILLPVILLAFSTTVKSQGTLIDDYAFESRVDSTAWISIDGIDSTIIAPSQTIYSIATPRIEMGFTFMMGSTACTHFSTNVNGAVGFGNISIYSSGYYNQPLGSSYGNSGPLPKVEPFGWRGQMDSSCYTRYAVIGGSGNHVLVIETRLGVYNQDSSYVSFQVQLHEATGELRIVYGQAEGPLPVHTTQTGLMRAAGDRMFIDIATNTVFRSTTNITQTNAAGVWPELWRCWSLTPDSTACPFPGIVTIVNNDSDSILLRWPSVAGAVGYRLRIPAANLDLVLTDTICSISELLNGATTYSGTLQTLCGGEHASYREREFTFTTSNGPIRQLPYVADFNDEASSNNWNVSFAASSTPRWQRKTNNPSPRMYTGYIANPSYDATAWLISPPILLPQGGNIPLVWDYRSELNSSTASNYYGTPTINVMVSICDTSNVIDTSAAVWDTLMTLEGPTNGYRTYGLTLNGYDGHRIRVAFVRRGKCFGTASIDNVRVGTDDTLVRIYAPLHPMVGEQTDFQALHVGGDPTAPFTWQSAMVDAGQATMYGNGTYMLSIIYNNSGYDTLTVQHGDQADTLVLLVKDCATVTHYPWSDDLENSADCWTLPEDDGWLLRLYGNSAYDGTCFMFSRITSTNDHHRMLTPTFVMPSGSASTGLSLVFHTRCTYNNSIAHLSIYFVPDSNDAGPELLVKDTLVSWNSYQQCIIPLTSLAGRMGRLAFEHWISGSSTNQLYLDHVEVRTANNPVVHLSTPRNAYTGEAETFRATISEGQHAGLTYSWQSTMLTAGYAEILSSGTDSVLNIVYTGAGIDTVTVTASNGYGSSTDTAIVQVCAPVDVYPWQADFSSQGCWYNMPGSDWTFTGGYLQVWGDLSFEGTVVSPALVVPTDTGMVLNWKVYGNSIYTVSISTGRYDIDTLYTTVLNDTAPSSGFLPRSISLDAYAGDTIHVAFHLDHQYTCMRIDSLILTNRNSPLVHLEAPKHVFADGNASVRAVFDCGEAGSAITWRSAMASRGTATLLTPYQPNLYIDYLTAGTDTITVVVSNYFGTDSATAIFTVADCDTVSAIDWSVNFSTDYDCWYRPAGCNWTSELSHIYSRVANIPFDSRIISPAISVPATADDSLVVEWTASASGSQQEHTLYMLITDGDYTDPSQYDTLVADTITYFTPKTYRVPLGAYANKVIHIAFVNNPIHLADFSYDYRTLYVYNLHVRSLRLPVVSLAVPSVTHVGENTLVRAELGDGSPTGLTYTWQSSMVDAGLASMTQAGDTLNIVYSTDGTDTIRVIASNAYGADTATATLTVQACAAIDSLPWKPPIYYGIITCWRRYNFTNYSNSSWSNFTDIHSGHSATGEAANNWLVTPAIELPATLDGSTVRWTLRAATLTVNNYITYPYMDVLLTTSDATDTSTFSHVLFSDYLTTGGGNNQRTYEASLDSFAGQTVYIAFVHRRHNGGTIYLDSISIQNGGRPEVTITPPTALNVGETCNFVANIVSGAHNGLTYMWHSTMAAAGLASFSILNSQFSISYTSDGIDTITVVVTNAIGSDTATVVMPVHNCPPVTLPWVEDFEDSTSAACWSTFAYHYTNQFEYERIAGSWQWSGDSTNHYMQSDIMAYDYLISPAITLPSAPTISNIVLAWKQSAYHPISLDVAVSPTGLYGGEENFTDTLCSNNTTGWHTASLLGYRGSTVRLAFIAHYSDVSPLSLDSIFIYCEYDTVWRTVTMLCDSNMGEVSGSGVYQDSSNVTITATAFAGYKFANWSDGDTTNPRNIFVVSDTAFTANFRLIDDTTGIDDISISNFHFSIYPNPAHGDVTISVSEPSNVIVLDLTGRTVIAQNHINSSFLIRHTSLPAGAYFVRVTNAKGSMVKKMIIK